MSDERLYTKEEVSLIVRDRVKRLNKRIDALELELSILRAGALIKEVDENGAGESDGN